MCRLCACNPTLEAFRCYLSTDAARFDQSLFFCVCPKMLPLLLLCQYRWYRNKVVYNHGLLAVLFISLHIENNGPEMVIHTWGAVLLHEVTTKLFPVRLMSAFFCYDHSGTFLTYNLPLTKTTLAPSPSTFKTHGTVWRTLSCWFQHYLEKKSNLQICVNIAFVFLLVFWRLHSSSPV